jgi:predicted nucleotide-binding protein
MARKPGTPNRNYPDYSLEQALEVPRAIQDGASGMPVSRLTLSELLGRSPNASQFRQLLLASRAYGLTEGGVNADQFELTQLGDEATGADEIAQTGARRKAVMNIQPYRVFLTAYNGKKVPSPAAFREFLVEQAGVPEGRADDCIEHVLADARAVGFIRRLSSGEYVDLEGVDPSAMVSAANTESAGSEPENRVPADDRSDDKLAAKSDAPPDRDEEQRSDLAPKKVFVAHGRDREPLDQLKRVLDQFKVKYAVAIDEPHRGRPISTKVASLMRDDCSSAIFIFTADEAFLLRGPDGDEQQVWRPSENLVYELGAASILYDRRIVIFKDKRVTFPSDFADLGYIEFEPGQLAAEMGTLFAELVSLDILEVRAKG